MSDISKISVKHFLNKNLTRTSKTGENKYPVYIKVTFQRKSTEIKSFIFYSSMTEYEFKTTPSAKFEQETAMIEFFVRKGYSVQGDEYSLKGIAEVCKEYLKMHIKDIYKLYVLNNFDTYLSEINEPFKYIILHRNEQVPTILYFMGALKLFSDKKGLMQFEEQFEIVKIIEFIEISSYYGFLSIQSFFDWQFGDLKVKFIKQAKSAYKLDESTISKVISVIDKGINQLV